MTTNLEAMIIWRNNPEWYTGCPYDPDEAKLTDKAPPEAVESYNLWQYYCHPETWDLPIGG